jgi:hypothetical protein
MKRGKATCYLVQDGDRFQGGRIEGTYNPINIDSASYSAQSAAGLMVRINDMYSG